MSVPVTNTIPEPKVAVDEHSAASYLEAGLMSVHTEAWDFAIENLQLALGTGNLNNAGRALVYWNLATCYIKLSKKDKGIEAYFSFIVVSQDILDSGGYITPDMDFVDDFNLVYRLAVARSYTNFIWASRSDLYGRSQENPILVHSMQELEILIQIARGECKGCDFERAILEKDGVPVNPHTERITQDINQFFVVVLNAKIHNDNK
jgi:hypothetical protein